MNAARVTERPFAGRPLCPSPRRGLAVVDLPALLWTAKGTDLCRLRHGAPPTAPALDRAAIDANDRSEPSISTTIAARQTRRPRKCSGARVSRIPVVEDTFRQRSPNFKPLQRYNRKGSPDLFRALHGPCVAVAKLTRKCLCHRHCSVVAV
jgi:hypothetical protein